MKKSLFYSMLATTMLFATSCQQDEVFVDGNEAVVQFQISTPEIATRAYSDGSTATLLQWAVYDDQGDRVTGMQPGSKEINVKTNVELKLAKGKSYHVLFWAAAPDAPYTVNFDTHTLTVEYDGYSNDEKRDAFYNWYPVEVNNVGGAQVVELRRPFAQLNIGTGDMQDAAAAGVTVATTKVTVTDVYNTLDFKEGSVTGEENVTFDYAAVPTNEIFPVDGYDYLAMNYVLVGTEKSVSNEVVLTYTGAAAAETRTFTSIPLQRNYRTNIYGDLLTKGVDFIVEIVPTYTNDHLELWDGTMLRKPTVDDVNKTIKISEGSELAWFAALVNGELPSEMRATAPADKLEGYTVSLECDIDLNNKAWTPIGVAGAVFKGTFDGNGHTIKNLNVDVTDKMVGDKPYSAGLFGSVQGTVKNLNIEKAVIKGNYKAGAVVGDGLCSRIENCHVNNAEIVSTPDANKDNANHVGGIVGYLSAELTAWVKNCTVKNSTVTAYRDVAAIAGTANGSKPLVEHNVAENVTVVADQTVAYKESGKAPNAGAIVGRNNAKADLSTNTAINVTFGAKVATAEAMATALTANVENIAVVLANDIDLPITSLGTITGGSGEYKLGGENTKNITIDLNGKKLNITTTYWSALGAKNNDALFTIKNGSMTSTGNSAGTWNAWDLRFSNCNYAFEGVKFEKAVALDNVGKSTSMKKVTITDTHNVDTYGLWITAEGQTVTLEDCVIDMLPATDGRGIKIDNQYVDTPEKVTLNVSKTTFKTEEKSAILVKSEAGAEINASELNIEAVAADQDFAVWVDDGAAAYADKVVVKGALVKVEGEALAAADTADELVAALESGKDVVLTDDVKIEPAGMSNAYGTTGINVKNGQTIDGGGHILDIKGAGGTWDSGISTTGGLIKNITVTGSFRGIFVNHNSTHSEKVVLENVIIDGTTYTISCDQGLNQGLEATNSTFKGWTSYAATLGNAKFTDCYFGKGNGYSYCRPYAPTEFVGCEFEAGYRMDPRAAVTFENCKIGGVALTDANVADLVTNTANATVK